MDGWSLPTLVLFPVPRLCVISPHHHLPSLFRQKTRASVSITKNLLITKGYQWWLLARCSFCPVLIIHSARGWEYGGLGERSTTKDALRLMSFQARYLLPDFLPKYCQLRSRLAPSPTLHPPRPCFPHISLALLCLMDPLPCAHLCRTPLPIPCSSVHTLTTIQKTQRLPLRTHKWTLRSFHDWCRITAISRKYLLNKSCLIDKKLGSFEDKQNSQVTHWFVADLSFKTHNYLSQNCFSPRLIPHPLRPPNTLSGIGIILQCPSTHWNACAWSI